MRFPVVHFRVFAEYPGDIGGQRAVHIYRNPGHFTLVVQLMQHVKQFLGSAERK